MLILLVGLDEHDGTRRRSILTTVKTIDTDGNPPPLRHRSLAEVCPGGSISQMNGATVSGRSGDLGGLGHGSFVQRPLRVRRCGDPPGTIFSDGGRVGFSTGMFFESFQ